VKSNKQNAKKLAKKIANKKTRTNKKSDSGRNVSASELQAVASLCVGNVRTLQRKGEKKRRKGTRKETHLENRHATC
jgi:hypothetical protein